MAAHFSDIDEENVDPLDGWESPRVHGYSAVPQASADAAGVTTVLDNAAPTGPGSTAPQQRTVVRPDAGKPLQQAAQPISASRLGTQAATDRGRNDDNAGDGTAAGPSAPRAHKRARHGCLSVFLWLAFLVVLAFMALRCLPSEYANGRAVPELASFVPLMFAPLLVCLAFSLLWRRRVLAFCTVAALAVMGWWHYGYFIPTAQVSASAKAAATTSNAEDSAARIMTLNTCNGNASATEVVALARSQHVEILCLQELTDDFVEELEEAGLSEYLPYSVVSAGASEINNGGRNGIWTLAPMSDTSRNLLPIETSSMPAASIAIGGVTVRVVSVHPNSPVRGAQDLWERGLSVIGSLSEYDHSYLIMGDFNSTWDHDRFRDLLGTSFVDAGEQSGQGYHMTYPSNSLIPSLIEIDHILYPKDSSIVVSELETQTVAGTDHKALLGTLEVK